MSRFKDRLIDVLEGIRDEIRANSKKLDGIAIAVVEARDAADRAYERAAEVSARDGAELHRHERRLIDHEGRLHRLESPGVNGAAE